jgi:hypothetical protein
MWRLINILRINGAPSWFYLQDYTGMHGHKYGFDTPQTEMFKMLKIYKN